VSVGGREVPPRRLWLLVAGFGIWCSALVVMYAYHAIGCAFGWKAAALRLGLAVALLLHVALASWLWRAQSATIPETSGSETGRFMHRVIAWTLIAALVTLVLTLGPALLLETCI
jgi:hypothetical protein